MFPKVGDCVKLTDGALKSSPNLIGLKDQELEIMKVSLDMIYSSGAATYIVYFTGAGYLRKIIIDREGKNNGCVVFDPWDDENDSNSFEPNEDDVCRSCGAVGEIKGMCCICPRCGKLIWGI